MAKKIFVYNNFSACFTKGVLKNGAVVDLNPGETAQLAPQALDHARTQAWLDNGRLMIVGDPETVIKETEKDEEKLPEPTFDPAAVDEDTKAIAQDSSVVMQPGVEEEEKEKAPAKTKAVKLDESIITSPPEDEEQLVEDEGDKSKTKAAVAGSSVVVGTDETGDFLMKSEKEIPTGQRNIEQDYKDFCNEYKSWKKKVEFIEQSTDIDLLNHLVGEMRTGTVSNAARTRLKQLS